MNQSNIIAAYLFIAFIVFITMRGSLRTYLGFFFGGAAPAVAPGSPQKDAANTPANNDTALASGITDAVILGTTGIPVNSSSLFNIRG